MAECRPAKMVKVVFRDATPGVEPGSFAAKPKTIYRLGAKYGRIEESLDTVQELQALTIVAEPDIWAVDLVSKTGHHAVDTGEPYEFHAPVVGGSEDPKAITEIEFGCELNTMKAKAPGQPRPAVLDGNAVDQYELKTDQYRVVLSVASKTGKPVAFFLYEGDKLSYDMRYDEYATELDPDLTLFRKPDGIAFTEADSANSITMPGLTMILTEKDFDDFMNRYYLDPHPDLVGQAIGYLGSSGALKKEGAAPPVYAFFTEIFARYPARLSEWTPIIDTQPDETRNALRRAVTTSASPNKLLDDEPPSPSRNDICWGAFFASGDHKYLTELMQQLRYMSERKDLNLFTVGGSAKWSLASNARSHPVVKSALEDARGKASGELKQQIVDVLTKSPGAIRQEMVDVIREQHAKGKW